MAGLPAEEPFEIRVDTDVGMVSTVLRGFWTMADLAAFGEAMAKAIAAVASRHRAYALLSDSTEFKVQSTEVSDAFTRITRMGERTHEGPTAIVVGSVLNKLQAERALSGHRVRVFTDADAARRWVEEELEAARSRG